MRLNAKARKRNKILMNRICVRLRALQFFQFSLVRDLHIVNINAVRRGRAVAIQLDRIRKLIVGAGEKRVVRDIHRHAHAIHGKRIVNHQVVRRVIVIFRHNMVPGVGREASQREAGRVPSL